MTAADAWVLETLRGRGWQTGYRPRPFACGGESIEWVAARRFARVSAPSVPELFREVLTREAFGRAGLSPEEPPT